MGLYETQFHKLTYKKVSFYQINVSLKLEIDLSYFQGMWPCALFCRSVSLPVLHIISCWYNKPCFMPGQGLSPGPTGLIFFFFSFILFFIFKYTLFILILVINFYQMAYISKKYQEIDGQGWQEIFLGRTSYQYFKKC